MASPAPPAADHKKPVAPPPAKKGAEGDKAKGGAAKAPEKAPAKQGQQTAASAPKGAANEPAKPASAGQQRLDRMAVRAKLAVSEPGDAVEREADSIADKVMRMPERSNCQASSSERPRETGPTQNTVARETDPKLRGGGAAAGKAEDAQKAKGSVGSTAPKHVQPARPQTTDGTHGGLATEQSKPEIARAKEGGHAQTEQTTVPGDFADKLGMGTALDPQVRASFEQRMGCDLSGVRVHTDDQANVAAKQIQARAFTYGRHIAFAAGQYQPDTPEGKRLLAHELAHVLQQRSDVVPRMLMRAPSLDVKGVTIPAFKFPAYKGPYTRPAGYNRGEEGSKQISTWLKATKGARDGFGEGMLDPGGVYVAVPKSTKLKKDNADLLVGTPVDIGDIARKPRWDENGVPQKYDVDHIIELQIGGPAQDTQSNLELRDDTSNRSSGSSISASIDAILQTKGVVADLKRDNDLVFSEFKSGGAGGKTSKWSLSDIDNKKPREALNIYDPDLNADAGGRLAWPIGVDKKDFFGSPDLFVLYPSKSGGAPKQIELNEQKKPKNPNALSTGWIPGIKLSGFDLNLSGGGNDAGKLTAAIDVAQLQSGSGGNSIDFTIKRMSGKQQQAGYINTTGALNKIKKAFNIQPMSPVDIQEFDLLPGTGLMIVGKVNPSLGLIAGADIDLVVQGQDLRVEKTFTGDELTIPGPFKVKGSSLTIALGSQSGFSVTGIVNFAIDKLGEGSLKGLGQMSGFAIRGDFEFDKKLFDVQAHVGVSYVKEGEVGKFSGEGDILIGPKIRGIRSASAHVLVDDNTFTAKGTAQTDIPGVKSFDLAVNIDPQGGAAIEGDADLGNLPAVESAKLKLKLDNSSGKWKLGGSGDVTPKLPGLQGLSGNFKGSYDDGLVLIQGSISFDNGGVFSGSVTAGVTNGSVDDKGNLTGKAGGKSYSAFGTAQVDAKITDNIKGKVTLRLVKDGSVRIKGRVEVPEAKLFDRYPAEDKSKKTLFDMTTPKIPVPGLAISVGSVAVGLNVSIKGGLYSDVWIGPGKFVSVYVEVEEFDPKAFSVDVLHLTGGGQFVVPAYAGLTASIDARVTLDAACASVGGSVGMEAEAGVKPQIDAGAKFTWSKSDGLDVEGDVGVVLKPVLSLSLNGKVFVEANIIVDTITLWEKKFDGPKFELDPGISLNARLKGGYNSKTKEARIDPPVFGTPKLDVGTLMGNAFGKGGEKTETREDEGQVCQAGQEQNASFPTSEPDQSVMPKRDDGEADAPAPQSVDESVVNRLGSGAPLDLSARGFFEQRMRADLTRVRIHTGPGAARDAERLSARAFTVGNHIAFAAGEYQPNTPDGQELIAHELAHVAQQQGGAGETMIRRWPAVTRTTARTAETPATIRALSLSDFVTLTQTQLDWATSPDLQADAAALGQFRDLETFADGPHVVAACGGLNMGGIIGKGIPAVYPALRKYTEGVTSHNTAWLRRTADVNLAERWGTELTGLEAAWPAANLSLVMRAPDPVTSPSPFEKLEDPAAPELPNFISYLTACSPILSADNGREVDSFLSLRREGAMPNAYVASITHVKNYHHFTKVTLDALAVNEAVPQWRQQWSLTQRPLTVVLYPAVDHNGAFHRNLGLQSMVTNSDILTIVVEGLASVADYQAQLAPVASRYGANGRIAQAMIGGHGNSTILQLAGAMSGAGTTIDTMGTTGAEGTNTTNLMTELTHLMSSDPTRRRIVLDACLTNSHHVASALRASPADAAADVNAAIAADPSLRDVVAGIAGAGSNVSGANASFAPAQTTFMAPGTTTIGLSVPGDPDLISSKLAYVEFGTEPEGCMRALLECWAADQIAGTHECRTAVLNRIGAGSSAHVAPAHADSWRESIIQPIYDLAVHHYWGNGEALRQMGMLAGSVFELFWPNHTSAGSLDTALGVISGNAAHVDRLLASVSGDPHYAATPRVALVIEQVWMQYTAARHANFLTALASYATCLEASADADMGMIMPHVGAMLTVPPPSPPPAGQLRLALLAAQHAPVGTPPPSPLPAHVAFLRGLLGAGPTFPAALNIDTVLGGLAGESDILAAIGRPLAGVRDPAGPPPEANIDTVRDATTRNDFRVSPLRATGVVSTARDDLMVRSTPTTTTDSNIFNRLPPGAAVVIIGEYGTWYVIEQPGRTGFVAKRYITR